MTDVNKLNLFKNLCDWDLDSGIYRDLHNDFDCVGIALDQRSLTLKFRAIETPLNLDMIFTAASLCRLDISFDNSLSGLTLGNLYRGRFEVDGRLIDLDEQGRGYLYLEFYEGLVLEFWASSVSLEDCS